MTVTNGIKTNGKIKSKNQLRRLKAKQKKAEQGVTPVCLIITNSCTKRLIYAIQETSTAATPEPKLEDEDVTMNVEYVSEQLEGAALEAFSDVFARFQAHAQSSVVRRPHNIIIFNT